MRTSCYEAEDEAGTRSSEGQGYRRSSREAALPVHIVGGLGLVIEEIRTQKVASNSDVAF